MIRDWKLLSALILGPLLILVRPELRMEQGCMPIGCYLLYLRWPEERVYPAAATGAQGQQGLHLKGSEAPAGSPQGQAQSLSRGSEPQSEGRPGQLPDKADCDGL